MDRGDIEIFEDSLPEVLGDEYRCKCPSCGGGEVREVEFVGWGKYWPSTYDTPGEYEHEGLLYRCADCGKEYIIEY